MLRKLETYLENKILTLPSWLSAHLKRTADIAVELANIHEADPTRCKLSALAHDIAKTYDNIDLIKIARTNNLECSEFEFSHPEVLHGPVAAFHLNEYISEDISLFNSIRWHTSGNKNFDTENKIVFMSDKIDPNKINKRPELNKIKDLSYKNLDHSIIEFFETQFDYLTKNNIDIHPESKKYYEYLT